MVTSTFVCVVSVKSRNLDPVMVLKHCRRKFSVSMTSRPEGGWGRSGAPLASLGGGSLMGSRRAVMACTLVYI